jgi:hypothetical protein
VRTESAASGLNLGAVSASSVGTDVTAGHCAPLIGAQGGLDLRLSPTWRIAPSVGVAFNTRKSSESSAFAEVEINRWTEKKGFIGTGLGVWDFAHSKTVAPVLLVQAGIRLVPGAGDGGFYFVPSGRVFLNKMDNVSSNYQFFGGFRYIFP